MLKAIKPQVIEPGKPKFMLSGRPGVGKSLFGLQFPTPYYIDTEGGAVRKQYREALSASGGAYFGKEQGSQDFATVIEEIKTLATTKHDFKTLVIDSFSHLYNTAAAAAEEKIGNDFGRDKKEANRPSRQLLRWLENIDMTVLLICHSRQKWERRGKEVIDAGTTFDGFDKLEFSLDLWIEAQKMGKVRSFIVKKSRIDTFQEGEEFPLDYKKFAELYGVGLIEKAPKPVTMATEAQVNELEGLLAVVKYDPATVQKWLDKANAENFSELNDKQITACIEAARAKVATVAAAANGGK